MTTEKLISAARAALADLQSIMPEFDADGDRKHSGWKTILDLADALGEKLDDYWYPEEEDLPKKVDRALEILHAAGYDSVTWINLIDTVRADPFWECFDDDDLSNGWVIRPVDERTYGQGFVLDRGPYQGQQYAEELKRLLEAIAKESA